MTITKQQHSDQLTLALAGRLDTTTAPELETAIKEASADIKTLTIDMAQLEYLSSAGLRVLLAAHKEMEGRGKLVVRSANEMIMEIFTMTGFTDILNIEK